MANLLKMATVQSILSLHEAGWSQRRIARELGINRETVSRHLALAQLATGGSKPANAPTGSAADVGSSKPAILPIGSTQVGDGGAASVGVASDAASAPGRGALPARAGRPSDCEPWRSVILAKMELGLSARRIHQDLTADHGAQLGYDSVRRFLRRLGPGRPLPFRRMECAAGQEAQVDFGTGAPVTTAEGKRRRPHVFRIVLSHSRKAYSEASYRQTTEDFIRCLENAFWHFGGAPKTLVIDNLRAAVKQPDWYDPELNPKLLSFCQHYNTVILPTKSYTPRHKGKIERGIDYVKDNGLKGRTFSSLEEENRFLLDWEMNVADKRIHGTTRQQVGKVFADVERAVLEPLPTERFPFFHEGERSVHRDGHVEVANAYYSVPPEYLARRVWIRWDARLVRIFNHRMEQIALHTRHEAGKFSTQGTHVAPEKISGVERGAQWLLGKIRCIGTSAHQWAEAMLAARGIEGVRVLQGLVSLANRHPAEALEKACETALSHGAYRLRTIRQLIQRRGQEQQQFQFLDEHPIIRPLADYTAWVGAALVRGAAAPQGFLRHDRENECWRERRERTLSLQEKSPGGANRRGLRVIHPPRPGYPSSGCSPAEPDSVSPDNTNVGHFLPSSQGNSP